MSKTRSKIESKANEKSGSSLKQVISKLETDAQIVEKQNKNMFDSHMSTNSNLDHSKLSIQKLSTRDLLFYRKANLETNLDQIIKKGGFRPSRNQETNGRNQTDFGFFHARGSQPKKVY